MATFGPVEHKMRMEGLAEPVIASFRRHWEQLAAGETGLLPESRIEPVFDLPDLESIRGLHGDRAAMQALVVVKLNGGLGTSMGMTKAKSLLVVKDGLTFLDIVANQVVALRREYEARIPLVLMNSFRTREDSLEVLRRHAEIASDVPADFVQSKVPKIRVDDLTPAEWPAAPELEWCPPGHGDLYTALLASGMLERLLDRGYRWAFVSNSDNLGAVPDPAIPAWMDTEGIPFVMEVAARTQADRKGGHLARHEDGRLVLREIAQCPPDESEAFSDVERYCYFNTNNLWVDLRAVARESELRDGVVDLPLIRNVKHLDPTDPSTPEVYQLETAMGAAISVFEGARAVAVPRERFAPVKTTNDLLKIWSDIYALSDDWRLVACPERAVPDLVVDLDAKHYRMVDDLSARFPEGAPSLLGCTSLKVDGDITFGARVRAQGDVVVTASGAAKVGDDTVLSGPLVL